MKRIAGTLGKPLLVLVAAAALACGAVGCSDLTCEDDCADDSEQLACEICSALPGPESACVEDNCLD